VEGGDKFCFANMVFPTKSRFYILVLGIFMCPVASGKFGGFKILCSIIWQVLYKLLISFFSLACLNCKCYCEGN
jgi:hypothetical protein